MIKYPDPKTGEFIYRKVKDNKVIVFTDSEIIKETPILYKGILTDKGEVIDLSNNIAIVKSLQGKNSIHKSINLVPKEDVTINEKPERLISGKFDTLIGKVKLNDMPEILKSVLINPSYIEHNGNAHTFYKSLSDGTKISANIERGAFGGYFVNEYSQYEPIKEAQDEPIAIIEPMIKAFGFKLKMPKIKTPEVKENNNNGDSKERANHKYIERKANPEWDGTTNTPKYIYKYYDANGNIYWSDNENENGFNDFDENSDNYNEQAEAKRFRIGDKIIHEGTEAKIYETSDNLLLIEMPDRTFRIIGKNSKKKIQAQRQEETNPLSKKNTNKDKDEAEYRLFNGGYKEQDEYKDFTDLAIGKGFHREDDLTYSKYNSMEGETFKITRKYDPRDKQIRYNLNDSGSAAIQYKGKTIMDNIEDFATGEVEGFIGTNTATGKREIFSIEDYMKIRAEQNENAKISETENRPLKIEFEKDNIEPQVRRITKKRNQQLTAQERAEQNKRNEEHEKAVEESNQKRTEVLASEEYKDDLEKFQSRGFKQTENPFILSKKLTIEGVPFTFRAQYDPNLKKFSSVVSEGKYKEITTPAGEKYQITDIMKEPYSNSGYTVAVNEGDIEKIISLDELIEANGKNIFEPTGVSKGLESSLKPQVTYFNNTEKELTKYEVIELKDLILSHHTDGTINNNYHIKTAQNRDRTSEDSKQQIAETERNIVKNFDLFMPNFSRSSDHGASIVNDKYEAIAGNGRGLAIAKHYEGDNKDYKNQLIERAEELGFDPIEIQKMEQPIIVRKLIGNLDDKRLTELGVLSNEETKLAQSDSEIGKAKSKLITPQIFNEIVSLFDSVKDKVSGGTISEYLDMVGLDVLNALVGGGVIKQNEVPSYYDQKVNRMNSTQKSKIKSLLTQYLFSDNGNYLDHVSATIENGITDSLGTIIQLKGTPADILQPLGEALKLFAKYESVKQDFKGNSQMFLLQVASDIYEPITADAKTCALFESLLPLTSKEIRSSIKEYKFAIEGDVFSEPLSPEEAFTKIFPTNFPNGIGMPEQPIEQETTNKIQYPEKLSGEADKAYLKRIKDTLPDPKSTKDLPEEHDKYFNLEGSITVPLSDLVSSKTDEENKKGGNNAPKFMRAAYDGIVAKRDPIEVTPIAGGKYKILDGNGTFTGVSKAGWKELPVKIVEENKQEEPEEPEPKINDSYAKLRQDMRSHSHNEIMRASVVPKYDHDINSSIDNLIEWADSDPKSGLQKHKEELINMKNRYNAIAENSIKHDKWLLNKQKRFKIIDKRENENNWERMFGERKENKEVKNDFPAASKSIKIKNIRNDFVKAIQNISNPQNDEFNKKHPRDNGGKFATK